MNSKVLMSAVAFLALVSCSSDALVSSKEKGSNGSEVPMAFSVDKRNITRAAATSLENNGHYNFGVWAYKAKEAVSMQVMDNYLVGYSNGAGKGYDNAGATTWNSSTGSVTDHTSPWFYEKLGTADYLNSDAAKGYTKDQTDFMSANANQYLRYWDLAYDDTRFYAYAPYRSAGVSFDSESSTITVLPSANPAGYDDPALYEFIYASASAKNADMKDVQLKFKHLGAQLRLSFCEDIPGYQVKLLDVTTPGSGIQATPAVLSDNTYTKASYYTSCGATISYSDVLNPVATISHEEAQTTDANLVFQIPSGIVPAKGNADGSQNVAWSSTVYYATPQPAASTTGLTFHVSYQLIAEDNGEEITIHDARVYVPANVVNWQPNTRYVYAFKFTTNSTGTTDPNVDVDLTDPMVPATPNVYPIVFDGATIEEYTLNESAVE